MKKMCFCPVALAAALLVALFLASCSNVPGNPPIVAPLPGIGTPKPQPPAAPDREILQSAHAKVYKVPGGLMFKITRPTEDVFNPQKVVKEEAFNDYEYVGEGKGSYSRSVEYVGEGGNFKNVHEYVGQGNGSYKLIGKNHYKEAWSPCGAYRKIFTGVGEGNGNVKFENYYENVGDGNGMYVLENGEYKNVGYGNGNYMGFGRYVYVGDGNGDYKLEYVTAAPNGGDYNYTAEEVDEYFYVGDRRGDYNSYWTTVKDGSGDHNTVYTNVGQGNGSYEYKDTIKTYGNWNYVQITSGNCRATVDLANSADKNELSCFWPLCEPGKLCEYEIAIEPYDGNLRDSVIVETLVVAADEGLGGIKEATIDNVTMTYVGNKPQVKIDGLTAVYDNMVNPRSSFDFFATNQSQLKADGSPDFGTNYACQWFGCGTADGIQNDFVWNSGCRSWDPRDFDQIFDDTQKDSIYMEYYIRFEVPSSSGFETWRNYPKGGKSLLKIR